MISENPRTHGETNTQNPNANSTHLTHFIPTLYTSGKYESRIDKGRFLG